MALERLKYINCNICGSDRYDVLQGYAERVWIKPPLHLVRCLQCGLAYLNPQPDFSELSQYYSQVFPFVSAKGACTATSFNRLVGHQAAIEPRELGNQHKREAGSGEKARLTHIEDYKPSRGRLLDIGCADGAFLAYTGGLGWKPYGVELSATLASIAQREGKLDVFNGTVEDAGFPEAFFDVVHVNHVLEHLSDPHATLVEIRRILRPDGLLYLGLPNEIDTFDNAFGIRHLLSLVHPQIRPSDHLFFFTPNTIRMLLHKAGFIILETRVWSSHDKGWRRRFWCKSNLLTAYAKICNWFRKGDLMEIYASPDSTPA